MCVAKASNLENCPNPTARAYDHHDGELNVVKHTYLVNNDGTIENRPTVTYAAINYNLRSEWLMTFDANDGSGNKAEQIAFALILNDPIKPVITPYLAFPITIEACDKDQLHQHTANPVFWEIPWDRAAATDNYDGILTTEMKLSVQGPGETLAHAVTYTYKHEFGDSSVTKMIHDCSCHPNPCKDMKYDATDGKCHSSAVPCDKSIAKCPEAFPYKCKKAGAAGFDKMCYREERFGNECTGPSGSWCALSELTDSTMAGLIGKHGSYCDTTSYPVCASTTAPSTSQHKTLLDTHVLGGHTLTFTVHDHAGMFGEKGKDNLATLTGIVNVVDTKPPLIYCKSKHCHLETGLRGGTVIKEMAAITTEDCCNKCEQQQHMRQVGSIFLKEEAKCRYFTFQQDASDGAQCVLYKQGEWTPPVSIDPDPYN
jgi:hypothetical protein